MVTGAKKSEDSCFLAGMLWQTSCAEKQRHHSADKGPYSQGYGLPSGHVWLWELDHKKRRASGNRCLQTVVLEKILENPLDSKEIKQVNLKWNQPWILNWKYWCWSWSSSIWSPDANSWLVGKVPDAGKDWEQKEKRCQRMRWMDGITDTMGMHLGKLWEIVRDREAWRAAGHGSQRVGHDWAPKQQKYP